MPDVDFMIACDYVRAENGIMHLVSGGFDRIIATVVPTLHNFGVAIRLSLARHECDVPHKIELVFQGADGEALARIVGQFASGYPANVPPGWPAHTVVGLNLTVPLPRYGTYSVNLSIDDQPKESLSLFVTPPDPTPE